jgi:hypothetical protein
MGWIYDGGELKTKQDYIEQLKEIEAYRSLDGLPFDFGTGLIPNEMSLGSEDAYYEMDIQNLEGIIEYWDYVDDTKKRRKYKDKLFKYYKRKIDQKKLSKLYNETWWAVQDCGEYKKRCYIGSRTTFLKKYSNKIVRRYVNEVSVKGNGYRRLFDYWWEIW